MDGGTLAQVPRLAGRLNRALDDTASSYKFFWLLALLKLLPKAEQLEERDILLEMMALAWAPVALFRLSFGVHDRLPALVIDLQTHSRLPGAASTARVKRAFADWPDGDRRLDTLARYVPTRFLAPWLAEHLPLAQRDDLRTKTIASLAGDTIGAGQGPPYALRARNGQRWVDLDPIWRQFLLEQAPVVRAFAEMQLARFLQSRNPHVPAIVDKLGPPPPRNLASARSAFQLLARRAPLTDLYTGEPLEVFALDHVAPRSFVAHDLIWNLAPMAPRNNGAKGDRLPDLAVIPALARLHHTLIATPDIAPRLLEDYVAAFNRDLESLRAIGREAFEALYLTHYTPLLQIAQNQGFQPWLP
jgi:hypothetical protein